MFVNNLNLILGAGAVCSYQVEWVKVIVAWLTMSEHKTCTWCLRTLYVGEISCRIRDPTTLRLLHYVKAQARPTQEEHLEWCTHTILHSYHQCIRVPFPPHPYYLLFSNFWMIAILIEVRWNLIIGFTCISLLASDPEYIFMCLLTVFHPLKKDGRFIFLAHFLTRLFCCYCFLELLMYFGY